MTIGPAATIDERSPRLAFVEVADPAVAQRPLATPREPLPSPPGSVGEAGWSLWGDPDR